MSKLTISNNCVAHCSVGKIVLGNGQVEFTKMPIQLTCYLPPCYRLYEYDLGNPNKTTYQEPPRTNAVTMVTVLTHFFFFTIMGMYVEIICSIHN